MRPEIDNGLTTEEAEIKKLQDKNAALKAAYEVQEIELEMERHRGELLEERVDALRSLLPNYGNRVERWLYGAAVAL